MIYQPTSIDGQTGLTPSQVFEALKNKINDFGPSGETPPITCGQGIFMLDAMAKDPAYSPQLRKMARRQRRKMASRYRRKHLRELAERGAQHGTETDVKPLNN